MKKRPCITIWFVLLSCGALTPLSTVLGRDSKVVARPSILFILADDFGIDGVGCYGSDRFKGKTPHLDALAKTGTRFDRCYAAPVCGPARCMFISGRYAFRTGGLSNGTAGRPTPREEPSVGQILKQAGYVTGIAGKWRQMSGTADEWGFDDYMMSDVPRVRRVCSAIPRTARK